MIIELSFTQISLLLFKLGPNLNEISHACAFQFEFKFFRELFDVVYEDMNVVFKSKFFENRMVLGHLYGMYEAEKLLESITMCMAYDKGYKYGLEFSNEELSILRAILTSRYIRPNDPCRCEIDRIWGKLSEELSHVI